MCIYAKYKIGKKSDKVIKQTKIDLSKNKTNKCVFAFIVMVDIPTHMLKALP